MALSRVALVFVALLALAPSLGAVEDLAVSYRAGVVQPGDVLHLAVTAPAGVGSVSGTWHERTVPFVRDADGVWRALLGIDVAAAAGPQTLVLTAGRSGAGSLTLTHTVTVSPKAVCGSMSLQ